MADYTFKANDGTVNRSKHYLKNDFFEFVIRDNRILSILEKVATKQRFSEIISQTKPYGVRKYLFNEPERYPNSNLQYKPFENSLKIHGVKGIKGGAKRIIGYVSPNIVSNNKGTINKHKLFFTTTYSTNAINPPEIIIGEPGAICTETFLLVGPFETEHEQNNCLSYMETNFFKLLLYFGKGTMQVTKSVFGLIPLQDFSEPWTDEKLYKKYGLTEEEIAFIESMIRPME
jgi:site-specific DNA-methyltransferase (adenine-specific)